jgi:hypothetical protein
MLGINIYPKITISAWFIYRKYFKIIISNVYMLAKNLLIQVFANLKNPKYTLIIYI